MSGVRCPSCDYDLEDCACEDRLGPGVFRQMGVGDDPTLPRCPAAAPSAEPPATDDLVRNLRASELVVCDAAADLIERQAREIAEWKVWPIAEIAARNPSVMEYMRHWEGRAERAEAERDALRECVKAADERRKHQMRCPRAANMVSEWDAYDRARAKVKP